LKHGLFSPDRVVSLRRLDALRDVHETESGGLFLGAGLSLAQVAAHPMVRSRYPALAESASLVAGPQLREMGTLGGNLCLETRCVFYNQTHFWRDALGYCLKKDGSLVWCPGHARGRPFTDTPGPLTSTGDHDCLLRGAYGAGFGVVPRRASQHRAPADELVLGISHPGPSWAA
jgi:CO/xanthine dehydrogenase FAD-binding subunit